METKAGERIMMVMMVMVMVLVVVVLGMVTQGR